MTYQDPDPLRDRDLDSSARIDRDYGSNAMWGWIAGAVVLVLLLVFLFGGGTTDNTNPASNQGASAPVVNTPPANQMVNQPRGSMNPPAASETTGQTPPPPSPSPSSPQQ